MKILLLNPPYLKNNNIFMKEIGRCGSTATGNQFWPQTGLAYLAAIAERDKKNHVMIIDSIAEEIGLKETMERVKEFSPDIVIVHTTTPTFNNDSNVLSALRNESGNTVFGFVGTHTANTVRESLQESEADFVIINEPELTLEALLDALSKHVDWKSISGLGYKKDGRIILNPLRPLSKNLDDLPFPARHLLPNHKYRMVLTNNNAFATLVSSRGCPYQCIYCRVGYPWGKRFRQRTEDSVFREMKEIREKYGIRNIAFMADTFTLNRKWVLGLCDRIIKERLDVRWMCNSRIDTIDKEMAVRMKRAGCFLVSFGIESGSQEILDFAKKNVDLNKAGPTVRLTKKAGMKTFAYFVIGLPGETKKTIRKTILLAKELDPDYVNFHIATPHPGTELQAIARKNNWIIDEDYDHYDQSGNYSVMRNSALSAEEILRAQKKAMKEFYLRPKIILRKFLEMKSPRDLYDYARIGFSMLFKN
ncbi:radical SAM protein [Candidatus Woesearchaeota archaeon]|nr:radical SAM protein [Candidatus Woesearchaeota archaeon]